MNKTLFKAFWAVVIPALLFSFSGCSDDSDDPQDLISSNVVCMNWGASKSEVMGYMKGYEMNAMEDGFICYMGKGGVQTISYQLQDEVLQASLMLIPQDRTSLAELQSLLKGYECLGEKTGLEIYVNEAMNTMATIGKKVKGEIAYYAIGYTALDMDLP